MGCKWVGLLKTERESERESWVRNCFGFSFLTTCTTGQNEDDTIQRNALSQATNY